MSDEPDTREPPVMEQKAMMPLDHPARQRERVAEALKRQAMRRGTYSPGLGKGYHSSRVGKFRRCLEDAVLARHGDIGMYHASLIHTAYEAMRMSVALVVEKKKAEAAGLLTPELALSYMREYTRLLDVRDRKLKELGLDATAAEQMLSRLYGKRKRSNAQ